MKERIVAIVPVLLVMLIVGLAGCNQQQSTAAVVQNVTPQGPINSPAESLVQQALPQVQTQQPAAAAGGKDIFARITVNEGELVKLDLDASDPDGDPLTYAYSKPLNAKGEWQTKAGDAGDYVVTISASDGKLTTSKNVLISVKGVNQAPVLAMMDDVTALEGQRITLSPTASDPNKDQVRFSFTAPLDSSGSWQTKIGDRGLYNVTVTASDGQLSDSEVVHIRVLARNHAPVLSINSEFTVNEGEQLVLNPTATDPDGDQVTIIYSGWMNSGTYTPKKGEAGKYKVVVTATDGSMSDSKVVWVTVNHINRPPEIHGLLVK